MSFSTNDLIQIGECAQKEASILEAILAAIKVHGLLDKNYDVKSLFVKRLFEFGSKQIPFSTRILAPMVGRAN